jgi:V/A-type H+-transporting ATPase subunit I
MVLAFLGIAPFNSMIIEGLALGMLLGAAILVLSIIMLYLGEGVRGMIELPALLSNILSYARLFAVGLASVQLALIINGFAEDFIAQGGVMIVAAIVILILGHGVNITLGILGSFLHSLRLHYVEFFGKFFEGGGPRYSPFGLREN